VVDGTGLENRQTLTGFVGSNPTLSASLYLFPPFETYGIAGWAAPFGVDRYPVMLVLLAVKTTSS
jgi:hypothetical protein